MERIMSLRLFSVKACAEFKCHYNLGEQVTHDLCRYYLFREQKV